MFTRTGAVFSLPPAARGCSAEEGAVSSWHSPPAPFWGPHTPQMGARELPLPPRWCPLHPAAPSHEGKPPAPPQEMLGGGRASPSHGLETRNPISTVSSGRAGRAIWGYFIFYPAARLPTGTPSPAAALPPPRQGCTTCTKPASGTAFAILMARGGLTAGVGTPKTPQKHPHPRGLAPRRCPHDARQHRSRETAGLEQGGMC